MGDIRGFADSPFIWGVSIPLWNVVVMAGGRLKFYNLIAKILIDRERDAMYKINKSCSNKSCSALNYSVKKGVRIIRGVIKFPSEFGSKRGVRIIRGKRRYVA